MPTLVNNLRAIRGPITSVPISGVSGIIIEPDVENNIILVHPDETVLYDSGPNNYSQTVNLPETRQNFEYLKIICGDDNNNDSELILLNWKSYAMKAGVYCQTDQSWIGFRVMRITATSDTQLTATGQPQISFTNTPAFRNYGTNIVCKIYKVIGVNRKANA